MRKRNLLLILLFALSSIGANSQQPSDSTTSKTAIDLLNKRISDLEKSINDQKDASQDQSKKNTQQSFTDAIQIIQTGLQRGGDIEQIVPSTLALIATKDLSETLTDINNPTSKSLGTSFSEMVIESASNHLLPKYSNDSIQQTAKSKFKSILQAIYKGPLVQGLLNSNPITTVINGAIQQAGFFEKSKSQDIIISKTQIKNVKDNPISIPINTANTEGPSFTSKDMEDFNNDLAKRIEFYETMNQYGISQSVITQQLYFDSRVIKKSLKASRSEICNLLKIDPNDAVNNLQQKFNNISTDSMKYYLRDKDFKKTIDLSNYATDQFDEVKQFKDTVITAYINYIDGYVNILNKYKNIKETQFDEEQITKQIGKLNVIKDNLKSAY